ncbi:MAG: MaoC/PaaZ C-terminal domain-containing protein [Planctomycetota bacterium]|jgi:acyl dehydratase
MSYQPRGRYFEDFNEGDVIFTASRTITESDVTAFAGLSGDYNALHTDQTFAESTPFKQRVAHGMLIASIATGLANQAAVFEGTTLALLQMTAKWPAPVFFGDTIHLEMTVTATKPSSKGGKGVVTVNKVAKNQNGDVCMDSEWVVLMKAKS